MVGSVLTPAESNQKWDLIVRTMRCELERIIGYDAMKAVRMIEARKRNTISSRWVLTWEIINGEMHVNAMLVTKAVIDPQLNQIVTASAAASPLSHRMLGRHFSQPDLTLTPTVKPPRAKQRLIFDSSFDYGWGVTR